jgi:hypothetical protein
MDTNDGRRFYYRANKQFADEVARMRACLDTMPMDEEPHPVHGNIDSHRLLANPFFFKMCRRLVYDAYSTSMLPGQYIPFRLCDAVGTQDGNFEEHTRHINNTTFLTLLKDGWIGSRDAGTEHLSRTINQLLKGSQDSGRLPLIATTFRD